MTEESDNEIPLLINEAAPILSVIKESSYAAQIGMASRILRKHLSGEPPYQGWELPRELVMSHDALRNKISTILGVGEVTAENVDEKLFTVAAMLKEMYSKIDQGRELIQSKINLSEDYFPLSFYLGYLDSQASENKVESYLFFILAAKYIAVFELAMSAIREGYEELKGTEEFHTKYTQGVQYLTEAQTSYAMGVESLFRHGSGEKQKILHAIAEQWGGEIARAEEFKARQTNKSKEAREKWRPLILEVIAIGDSLPEGTKRWISDACNEVASLHDLSIANAETLRSEFYKYKKNPKKY